MNQTLFEVALAHHVKEMSIDDDSAERIKEYIWVLKQYQDMKLARLNRSFIEKFIYGDRTNADEDFLFRQVEKKRGELVSHFNVAINKGNSSSLKVLDAVAEKSKEVADYIDKCFAIEKLNDKYFYTLSEEERSGVGMNALTFASFARKATMLLTSLTVSQAEASANDDKPSVKHEGNVAHVDFGKKEWLH